MTVKFVSAQFVKENTAIGYNIDDHTLNIYIIKAQDTHLQQILGSSFMNHLYDAVANNTLTANEESLIREYIQRLVSEYAFYEAYPFIHMKATNKAVTKQNSENSTPVELSELKYLRSAVLDMAQFYARRLEKYLCDFQQNFPEYQNPNLPENLPKKTGRSYFGGIYLPKKGGVSGLETWDEPFEC
jgi:hypothetical protein